GGRQREGDVGRVELGVGLDVSGEALGCLRECGLCFGREQEWDRAWWWLLGGGTRAVLGLLCIPCQVGCGRLLQDHMRVGAADAEGGDAGAAGLAIYLPGLLLGEQLDLAGLP